MTDHIDDWNREIDRARTDLHGALTDAINALTRAHRAVTELTGDPVFDIEYAEGTAGDDTTFFISDSLRNCRAAYQIAHTLIERDT